MKVLVIVFGCVWPILLSTAQGVRSIDPTLRDTARSYRLTLRSRIFHLILPGASPQIAAGARQALSVGLVLMVISEMFAASNGIGYSIIQFQRNYDIPQMWTGIVLLGLIGVGLAFLYRMVESRWLSWYHASLRVRREGL
jgi:ABC-type nitrate/sulfonate/bicarbonate transport system permease component